MKHFLLSFAFAFGLCVPNAYAQRAGALTNTTWQLHFQECAVGGRPLPSKWETQMEITFLPGGKIKDSPDGVWKLTGNRLHVNAPELVIVDMNGTVNGAEINGNACLSMTCRENFCVRLVRQSIEFAQKPARVREVTNIVGYVDQKHISDGCGGTYNVGDRAVWSAAEFIWMNIDGQDVKLELLGRVSSPKGEVRKGQRIVERYVASDGTKIRIETIVTRGASDNYEGSDYVGTITVIKGRRQQKVRVVGHFGC